MAPGLRDGQLILTIRPRRKHRFRRGAVVAVDSREVGRRIVKRIIGLPGDHLRVEGSHVWVNGHPLDEPYASAATYRGTFDVPAGHYVLLGDNRDASSDSRSWRHPYVSRPEIAGILIRFPPKRLRGSSSRHRPGAWQGRSTLRAPVPAGAKLEKATR